MTEHVEAHDNERRPREDRDALSSDITTRSRLFDELQRGVGNRAVSRLVAERRIQRDTPVAPAAPAAIDMSQIKVTGGPSMSGVVGTAPSAVAGAIQIVGPQIESRHAVTSTGTLTESIEVGYVQTLQSANRVGVYSKGGTETARVRSTVPKSRDARPYKDEKGASTVSRPPWYDSELGGLASLSSGATANIHTVDKPSFPLDTKTEDGAQLSATEGDENFVLSVAAKPFGAPAATPVPGGSVQWSFSWKQKIDASGAGSGGGGIASKSVPGDVVTSDGEIAKNSAHSWLDFQTKDQAKGHPVAALFDNIRRAKAAGPDAATALANTVEALKELNPRFTATIAAQTRSSLIGSDTLSVTVAAKGSLSSTVTVGKDTPATIGFNMLTVCSDPQEFLAGLTVSVSVSSDWRSGVVGVATFGSLFEMATGKMVEAGSSPKGTYKISVATS